MRIDMGWVTDEQAAAMVLPRDFVGGADPLAVMATYADAARAALEAVAIGVGSLDALREFTAPGYATLRDFTATLHERLRRDRSAEHARRRRILRRNPVVRAAYRRDRWERQLHTAESRAWVRWMNESEG